jgi:type IV secretory pathway VirB10-like protein
MANQPPMPPEDEVLARKQAAQAAAKKRRSYLLLGAVVVVMVLVALGYWHSSGDKGPQSSVRKPGISHKNQEGIGRQSPKYARELKSRNTAQEKRARQTGGSFVPTPVSTSAVIRGIDIPQPATHSDPPPRANPDRVVSRPRRTPQKQTHQARSNADIQMAEAMAKNMQSLGAKMTPRAAQTQIYKVANAKTPAPATTQRAQAVTSTQDQTKHDLVRPGDLFYAVMDTALDSDTPGPVMATIVQGKLKRAKLLGGFARKDDRLVVKFQSLITESGKVIKLTAYAVDPDTSQAAIETSVNHHYLARWGGLIAGTFLSGFGQAVAQSGAVTTTTVGPGGASQVTSNPMLATSDQLIIAAGKTGEQAGEIAKKNFNQPPTVRVASGAGIGILVVAANGG